MLTLYTPHHHLHAPATEFFRGERAPAFEKPSRADYVHQELKRRGHPLIEPSRDCTPMLGRVHARRYLDFLANAWDQWRALDPANANVQPFPSVWPIRTLRSDAEPTNFIARLGLYSMDNGTPMCAGTWTAVKLAADAAFEAAERVADGARAVFCATRPPGHHAGADFMGGYCFLNNAAIAAETLRSRGAARVSVLDVDFHHGNGTQAIFYDRADVQYVSLHGDPRTEFPFYAGYADERGAGDGDGFNLNLPLPAGTEAAQWFDALNTACAAVTRYAPDALVVSLGLDTFGDDPISKFRLRSADFITLGARLAALGKPTVLVLEGGYAAAELGVNAANVLQGFENR